MASFVALSFRSTIKGQALKLHCTNPTLASLSRHMTTTSALYINNVHHVQYPWSSPLLKKPSSALPSAAAVATPVRFAATQVERSQHDHTGLWKAERLLSVALVGLIPAAFIFPSPIMDYALALSLVIHSHWGVEAIVVDYARPKVVGETFARLALALTYVLSAFTLGGLFYFNYSDVGLTNAIKMLWKL